MLPDRMLRIEWWRDLPQAIDDDLLAFGMGDAQREAIGSSARGFTECDVVVGAWREFDPAGDDEGFDELT